MSNDHKNQIAVLQRRLRLTTRMLFVTIAALAFAQVWLVLRKPPVETYIDASALRAAALAVYEVDYPEPVAPNEKQQWRAKYEAFERTLVRRMNPGDE